MNCFLHDFQARCSEAEARGGAPPDFVDPKMRDTQLTSQGRAQAAALRARMAERRPRPELVVSRWVRPAGGARLPAGQAGRQPRQCTTDAPAPHPSLRGAGGAGGAAAAPTLRCPTRSPWTGSVGTCAARFAARCWRPRSRTRRCPRCRGWWRLSPPRGTGTQATWDPALRSCAASSRATRGTSTG